MHLLEIFTPFHVQWWWLGFVGIRRTKVPQARAGRYTPLANTRGIIEFRITLNIGTRNFSNQGTVS